MAGTSSSGSDVVVAGAGSAGLAAAVAAHEAGARDVVVYEKAPEAGGNARFSHTGFRAAYAGPDDVRPFGIDTARLALPGYSEREYADDLDRATGGRIEPALRDRLAADSLAALRWMQGLGIRFVPTRSVTVDGREHFEPGLVLAAEALVDRWLELAAERGIAVRYGCAVEDVVPGGVVAGGRLVRARAVIVCSGGFQAGERLRARHLGLARAVVRGSRHDTGELLEVLVARGAARAGSWGEAVISPVDADSPPVEGGNRMNRYSYPYGITVDRDARRFIDEGAGRLADRYGTVGAAILARPGGTAFQLFDGAVARLLKHYAYRHARAITAGSVRELAVAVGLDPDALERTVADYNDAPRTGAAFDPARPDGLATRGLDPPKSNWALPLREPPFSAYAVTGGLTFTLGGVRVDDRARVLDEAGAPLPGVFATGDVVGLFHGGYPSGAGQSRNVVFARLAGAGAAATAREPA